LNITVVGTGYVGLVTGTCLAENGHDVCCVDIDSERIKMLNKGIVPVYEPGLEEIFTRNFKQKRLNFTCEIKEGDIKGRLYPYCSGHALQWRRLCLS
jgi:UDPglucose 6-dehydrogenase